MRVTLVTLGTTVSTVAVVANAFFQKKQFYPSVVYLTKSNPSMAVMYAQVFVLVFLLGKAFRRIFFGQLRAAELEHLIERFWFVITETCLAFTVFRDDFSPRFVALFTFLLFMKAFHWLVEDRVDYMERSPVITLKFHIRVLSLLFVLGTVDSMLIHHALKTTLASGASVQMVFGFEYAILLIMVVAIFMKYILHSIDMRTENPWESKTVYLLYNELVTGFIKCILYIAFVAVMVKIHTLPLFAIRPMYLSIKSFKKSLSDVILSRRAIAYMNTRFPDASPEELSQLDNTCIICREEMLVGKKLPCNHIFHVHCLRSWFQRQQSCPTCRMDVLVEQPPQPARPARPVGPAASPPPVSSQQPPVGPFHPPPSFGTIPPFVPFPPGTSAPPSTSFSQPSSGPSAVPPMDFPLFYGAHSFDGVNPPPPPFPMMNPLSFIGPLMFPNLNLNALSDDELRAMEGQERANVQARVLLLRNIHSLLDAAVLQLNQYACVISDLNNIANVHDRSFGTARGSEPPSSVAAPTYPCESESKRTDGNGSGSSVQVPSTVNPLNAGRDTVEEVPSFDVDSNSEKADEIRRRRLERFESTNANSNS